MAIEIVEKVQKSANVWLVQLTNDNGTESLFLQFYHDPTLAEVRAAGRIAIDNIIAQRQAEKEEAADKQTLMDAIYAYDATWTNNQTRNLLEAIIARIKAHKPVGN